MLKAQNRHINNDTACVRLAASMVKPSTVTAYTEDVSTSSPVYRILGFMYWAPGSCDKDKGHFDKNTNMQIAAQLKTFPSHFILIKSKTYTSFNLVMLLG